MTEQDKKLLLRDICARIPYGVKCTTKSTAWIGVYTIEGYRNNRIYLDNKPYKEGDDEWLVESIVPYLRPMSSMTEEEYREFRKDSNFEEMNAYEVRANGENKISVLQADCDASVKELDWLNKHHFDYRGLIEKGLVLEAPEGMYNN